MRFLVLASLTLMGFALAGAEQPLALEVLRKMATSRPISYIARAEAIRLKPQTFSATVTVYFKAGKRRVVYGDRLAPTLVLLDNGESVYQLQPDRKLVVQMPIARQRLNFGLLRKNYELRLLPSEQVAGRDCYVLVAQPKHRNNPTRKVWVDKVHFVVLRDELLAPDGTPVRIFVVKTIDFNADVDDSLFSVPSGWTVTNAPYRPIEDLSLSEVEKIVGFKVRLPRFVPEGYQLSGVGVTYCPHGTPIVHLQYSDGLNMISVFERPSQCRSSFGRFRFRWGWRRQPSCDWIPRDDFVYSQIVNDLRVIVIGHPSQSVMQRIAESIR